MSASLPQAYESIDFGELAEYFPPLNYFLIRNGDGRPTLNFKDDAANRALTQALLKRDFGLEVTLLEDRLCPPVPNRLNYVLWLTQVVKIMGLNDTVVGLDIGTGSTAIYPLLSCSLHKSWRFLATDIDAKSLAMAAANIERNSELKERIRLLPSTQDAPILFPLFPETLVTLDLGPETRLPAVAFSMCNPPFYSDVEDVLRSAGNKNANPHAVCTGALVEMITPGGEVAFVRRMLDESFMLQDACGWYTSLLGKMSSLIVLVNAIKEKGINNYAITELVQGNTRRWVIAWSFLDIRLPDTLARPKSQSLRPIAPPPNTLRHPIRQPPGSQPLSYNTLLQLLAEVPMLYFEELQDPHRVIATAHEVTWTRAARRRLARGPTKDAVINRESRPVVVSEIAIVDQAILEVRWMRGRDRGAFESFWGYLSGKLS